MVKRIVNLFIMFILIFLIGMSNDQNIKVKYFELIESKIPFIFYNELKKKKLKEYKSYYKVYFASNGEILKYEHIKKQRIVSYGLYKDISKDKKKFEIYINYIDPYNGKFYYRARYSYVFLLKDKVIEKSLFFIINFSDNSTSFLGTSVYNFTDEKKVEIKNYYNEKYLGRLIIKLDKDFSLNKILYQKFFEEYYDPLNRLIEKRLFKNSRLYRIKKYIYNSKGKLILIKIFNSSGKLISEEKN